jgi:hypothetical protein
MSPKLFSCILKIGVRGTLYKPCRDETKNMLGNETENMLVVKELRKCANDVISKMKKKAYCVSGSRKNTL